MFGIRRFRPAGGQAVTAILFLVPALLVLVAFRLWPAALSVAGSFQHNGEWVGLDNYVFLFQSDTAVQSLIVTLIYNVIINPVQIAIAFALALLLVDKIVAPSVWRSLLLIPVGIPLAVSSVVWGIAFRPDDGAINAILIALGFPAQPWLTSPDQALLAIMILVSWVGVGYWAFFLTAGLKDIPSSLLEAARIDGATYWQALRYIVIPLMKRPLAFVLVANTVSNFLLFPPIRILTAGGPSGSTNLIMHEVFLNAFTYDDQGLASAEMVILIAVLLLVVSLQFRFLRDR